MPKVTAAVLAALVALTLAGCAAPASQETDEPAVTQSSPEAPEPLVAQTAAPEEVDDPEVLFVAKFHEMRDSMAGASQIPDATDDQLIASGWEACELIRSGTSPDSVRLVDGEHPNGADVYADSSALMNAALLTLCPELI